MIEIRNHAGIFQGIAEQTDDPDKWCVQRK